MAEIEDVIRGLMACLMKAALYFPRHGKVHEAAAAVLESVQKMAASEGKVVLGIRERQIVYKGRPLYDISLYAARLIDAVRAKQAYGVSFETNVTAEEIVGLVEFLTAKSKGSEELDGARTELRAKHVTHIALEDMPAEISAGEQLVLGVSDTASVYQDSISMLQDLTISARTAQGFDVARVAGLAESVATCVRQRRDELLALTSFREYDEYTYNHSVNVCILTVALANSLTQDSELLVQIGEAALLHDVGKVFVPEEVLYKPSTLTVEEYEIVKTHPQRGASFLATVEGVHDISVSAAFGHHLGFDQSGYPRLEEKIHVDTVTLMINIADVYEALTSKRPYKKSMAPDKAAAVLVDGAGTQFDPALVRAFVRVLGLYPPGTRVRLIRGGAGIVQSVNQDSLDRPKVIVVSGPEGDEIQEPYVLDTSELNEKGEFVDGIKEVMHAED